MAASPISDIDGTSRLIEVAQGQAHPAAVRVGTRRGSRAHRTLRPSGWCRCRQPFAASLPDSVQVSVAGTAAGIRDDHLARRPRPALAHRHVGRERSPIDPNRRCKQGSLRGQPHLDADDVLAGDREPRHTRIPNRGGDLAAGRRHGGRLATSDGPGPCRMGKDDAGDAGHGPATGIGNVHGGVMALILM